MIMFYLTVFAFYFTCACGIGYGIYQTIQDIK